MAIYFVNFFLLLLQKVITWLLGLSSALVKTLTHYNLSANATAFMKDYFNTVLFRIYLIYFRTTVVKLF